MYLKQFGLKDLPFRQDFDHDYVYYSHSHEECLTRLLYTVNENKGAALLTGPHGTGKSLLLSVLRRELIKNGYQVTHVMASNLPPDQFIEELLYELGVKREGRNKIEMLHALRDLLHTNFAQDKELVVIVDEVQFVTDPETFMEMHQLLNIHIQGRCPVSLILAGESGVHHRLDDLGTFADRLVIKACLEVFNREDVEGYLSFRVEKAGGPKNLFSNQACNIIHRAVHGVPRSLNHVADLCLLLAASEGKGQVDEQVAHKAVAEWQGLS